MERADRFLSACRRLPVDATPVWIMRQAGRYLPEYRDIRARVAFLDLCKNPDLVAEVTVQPVTRLGVDAAILFSDILLPLEGMGIPVEIDDAGPRIPQRVRTRSDVARLAVPDPTDTTGFVMEGIRRTRAALGGQVPLIGFAGAPFTLAAYAVEGGATKSFSKIKGLLFSDPHTAHRLLERIARTIGAYLAAQLEAGAQALQIFDSWAGVLTPSDYAHFALPYVKQILESLPKRDVPIILFGVETGSLLEKMAESGADVIGVDWRVPLDEARARLGPNVAVQGNLDPCALLAPPEEIERRVMEVLARAGDTPGHVFNLGHGILPETPVEHAIAMVDAVHRLSGRPRAA
jgi:uroporphyrinogen decarboxylase